MKFFMIFKIILVKVYFFKQIKDEILIYKKKKKFTHCKLREN